MDNAPIAVFAFNRAENLKKTIYYLQKNELASSSSVTIFCDGPRSSEEKEKTDTVRNFAHSVKDFLSVRVVERERNLGCAGSVISGLKEMFAIHEKLIVIEDDIITSPYTLRYLNEALCFYEKKETIFSISAWSAPSKIFSIPKGYPYDVYAIPRFNCWGWASWKNRFESIDWNITDYGLFKKNIWLRKAFDRGGFDLSRMLDNQFEGKIDSWAIRADYNRFKNGKISINPVRSYVTNIGMGEGTHNNSGTTRYDNDISRAKHTCSFIDTIFVDDKIEKNFQSINLSRFRYIISKTIFYKKMKKLLKIY